MAETQKVSDRLAEPGEDDQIIQRFEVEFGMPVAITPEQQRKLYDIVSEIIEAPVNQLKEGVHWLAGTGCKPSYSKADAALLGKPVDPNAPDTGEPEYDRDTLYFESCARGFVSEKERARVLARRACRWCGRMEDEHGAAVPMVGSRGVGRPCPVEGATSQYYAPKR